MKCHQPWGLVKRNREELMNKPLRVLIVEDSEDDAELSIVELERGGYQPIHCRVDTAIALEKALDDDEKWDLILADFSMPQFTALKALEIIRGRELDLPFIIISARISEGQAIAMMRCGANDYLQKNQLARLLPVVERELKEAKIRHENRVIREKLTFLAFYDELTGLPNRSFFFGTSTKENRAKLSGKRRFVCCFIGKLRAFPQYQTKHGSFFKRTVDDRHGASLAEVLG
jgi:PleD family two-component response regulator